MAKGPQFPDVPTPPGRFPCPRCKSKGHVKTIRINARSKGQRGEREIVKILQVVVDQVRGEHKMPPIVIQRNALQAHLGGEDLHGLEGFAVEVKFCEDLKLDVWWEQCLRQARAKNAVPILMWRQSNDDWNVKWEAYVNTPKDRDQIGMAIQADFDDFLSWFKDAYDESLIQSEGHAVAFNSLTYNPANVASAKKHGFIPLTQEQLKQAPPGTYFFNGLTQRLEQTTLVGRDLTGCVMQGHEYYIKSCTCVEFPHRHCEFCHH